MCVATLDKAADRASVSSRIISQTPPVAKSATAAPDIRAAVSQPRINVRLAIRVLTHDRPVEETTS